MSTNSYSRRQFLRGSGAVAGLSAWPGGVAALLAVAQSACTSKDQGSAFKTLTRQEAREFEAIAARIIPTTDTPGAREAGVIHFIDTAFDAVFPDMLDDLRSGLDDLADTVSERFAGASFSALSDAQQDELLAAIEESEFFGGMRFLTFCGYFGMSKYGGNRGDAGWNLIGMDPHARTWQPPFGHYDAEYMEAKPDGE